MFTMSKINLVDVDIIAILLVIIVLVSKAGRKDHYSYSAKLFSFFGWSLLPALVLDIASWLVDGVQGGPYVHEFVYIINFLLIFYTPIPFIAWLCYFDYQIFGSEERLKKRRYYAFPFFITLTTLIMTLLSWPLPGFVYYIDDLNVYHRGIGMYILFTLDTLIFGYAIVLLLINREKVEKRFLHSLLVFAFIPIVGAALQLMFYGTLFIWVSTTLTFLFTYLLLEYESNTKDYLTGLVNRRQGDNWIKYCIRNSKKRGSFSLVMIDMDGFKAINDIYGHDYGDSALRFFASLLTQVIKNTDMAVRYAGDEFLLVLQTDSREHSVSVIERLRAKVDEFNSKDVLPFSLSFSAGCSVYSREKFSSYKDLLCDVDARMYSEKIRKR